ncbi:hypothetical protein ABC347_09130 [Sphingomonas sp. 1P06PA]|uniref:hypothetical protein n=1 Tax=Sphingomonas sp. 1P06PA TaxID=554121 RepID=UPI0039A6D341
MPACLFIGDSIAYGAGQAVNASGLARCAVVARVGAAAPAIARQAQGVGPVTMAVISAGSNGPTDPALLRGLATVRRSLRARYVLWVLPYNRKAAYEVTRVAFSFGDDIVDLANTPTADGVHPRSYQAVARWLLR